MTRTSNTAVLFSFILASLVFTISAVETATGKQFIPAMQLTNLHQSWTMTYFNQDDRQYLYQELEEALFDIDYEPQDVKNILQDCKRMNNVELRDLCVDYMPNILDDLSYNRSRR